MNASIGPLISTKKFFFPRILLPMAPASCTQQYLVFSSTDVQDLLERLWTKLSQACLPCFTSFSDTTGLCVFSRALISPKDRACTLGFSLYKHSSCGLQYNPCSNLLSLKRTSYLLIAKDNNCITGWGDKGGLRDEPYSVGMATLPG